MPHIPGKFVWIEHNSSKAAAAQQFYGEVLGWKVQSFPMPGGKYDMIDAGGTTIGGYAADSKGPAHWLSYMSVENVDDSAKKVVAAGGKVIDAPSDIPTVGRFAKVADPQGAVFYLFRSNNEDSADAKPAPGRLMWNELWARDAKKALAFYEKVFGYTHDESDMGGSTYYILKRDGAMRGGLMQSPKAEVPPMWLPYLAVADCDAMVARATKLGGAVHQPPTDIPGIGRFAVLGDPQGAAFAVMKPAE